jgi:DNA-binding response OmpR family regulator
MIGVIRVANSRILIVDDEELIRDLIKEYISLENFVADLS